MLGLCVRSPAPTRGAAWLRRTARAWDNGWRSRRGRSGSDLATLALHHPVEREVAERVHAQVGRDLLDGVRRGDQLLAGAACRCRSSRGRRSAARRRGNGPPSRPPARTIATRPRLVVPRTIESSTMTTRLPGHHLAHRVVLDLHLGVAARLRRLDEGPADVVVADQAVLQRDARRLGESQRRGVDGVGHGEDAVAPAPGARAPAAGRGRGGTGPRSRRRSGCPGARSTRARRRSAGGACGGALEVVDLRRPRSAATIARLQLADRPCADDVQGAALGGHHQRVADLAEQQRPEAARVHDRRTSPG